MNTKKSIKSLSLTAATVIWTAAFAAGAFAQGADTAYIPFLVNVNATVTAVPSAGTDYVVSQLQMSVTGGYVETVLRIPLPKTTGVINGTQKQISAPAIVNNGGGKVTLNLPAQSYKNAEISLYTVNGKQILRQKMSASSTANGISRPNAVPGTYLLLVTGADGGQFTSRLTHGGGSLTLNVVIGGENITPARQLAKEAASGQWTATVSATGRIDYVFGFTPVKGTNGSKIIQLREETLSAPTNVTATAVSTTSIIVSWSAASGAKAYYVYRSTNVDGNYDKVTPLFSTTSTTYTDIGLSIGATYYYKVIAYDNDNAQQSPLSLYASATVEGLPAGSFIDSRDGKTYKTVTLLGKKWMAENLNYATSRGSWCYSNEESNCVKYGRLYNWINALCPSGWHLPSRQEWGDLVKAAGGTGDYGAGGTAGTRLKSTTGWNSNGNGTDTYGFSALPGGCRNNNNNGSFDDLGNYGYWWTATRDGSNDVYVSAYNRSMSYNNELVTDNLMYNYEHGLSVRCVEN